MKKLSLAAALTTALTGVAAGWSPAAMAQSSAAAASPFTFTGNLTLASQYRYRGIEQTAGRPAVQGGFDLAHESGLYVGTWASNVSWLSDLGAQNSSLEWDFYGGFKKTFGDLGFDVGGLYYYYPGRFGRDTNYGALGFREPNTFELYAGVSWKMLSLKYSHAMTRLFGIPDSEGAGYLDLTGNFDVGNGFTVVAHVGHQRIPASPTLNYTRGDLSYTDWRLGVTKELVGLTFGLAYVDTNAKAGTGAFYRSLQNRDVGKGAVVATIGKTF